MNLYFWPMKRIDGIFLLVGTNLGNRLENIKLALQKISEKVGEIVNTSSVYETAAWGKTEQPDFYNLALEIATEKNPQEVLSLLQSIEKEMGRIRVERWEERIIDIDILYFSDQIINSPQLTVPHPEIPNRRFTLEPLNEIGADFMHPVLHKSNIEMLRDCKDKLAVKRIHTHTFPRSAAAKTNAAIAGSLFYIFYLKERFA